MSSILKRFVGGNKRNTTEQVHSEKETSAQQVATKASDSMASIQKALSFLETISTRRSIYALGRRTILPNEQVIDLVKKIFRESPTSFNSQTSRAVVLLGEDHERYWRDTVADALRNIVKDEEKLQQGLGRLEGFRKATGTVLFYEDQAAIKALQDKIPAYADRFPEFSAQSTGMAQVHAWTALELAGYGANLQHYGNLTQGAIADQFDVPKDWKLYAELVFGSPEGKANEKTYIDDKERFLVRGQ